MTDVQKMQLKVLPFDMAIARSENLECQAVIEGHLIIFLPEF